jgi:HEAT repeat protein
MEWRVGAGASMWQMLLALVRRAAVSSLAFSNLKPAADSITRALCDKDWLVRETAAETLGSMKSGIQSAPVLLGALSDDFWQVRLKATVDCRQPDPRACQFAERVRGGAW